MTTLHQTALARNVSDPSAWPAWTDSDTWELGPGPADDDAPAIDPADWAAICAATRRDAGAPARPGPTPLRMADLPAVQWFACQVAWQRSQSREDLDYHDLVATALNDVLCVLRDRKCPTAAALVALPGTVYRGIDLAAVRVPDEARTSSLAGCLDADVQYYLDLETELGNLAAWSILRHADSAEWYGSDTLQEYHDAEDAFVNAAETVEAEYPDNPLW